MTDLTRPRFLQPKPLLLFTATAATALVLSGCGGGADPSSTDDSGVSDGTLSGDLSIWAGSGEGDALGAWADEFEAANPGVSVEVTVVPQEELPTKYQAAIATGTTPDLTFLYSETALSWLSTEAFSPVPDGLIDPDQFFPATVTAGTYDDVWYTVPWYANTYTFLYRADLAEQAGLEAPATWEEYKPFLHALKEGGGGFGTGLEVAFNSYTAGSLQQIAASNGCSLLNEDETEWLLDSECVVEAADFWGSLFTEGLANPDGPAFVDQASSFVSGDMPSYIIGPWAVSMIRDASSQEFIDENLGVAMIPAGTEGSVGPLSGGSWAVFADAPNPDAAWKFVEFMTDVDQQIAFFEASGATPAIAAAWDDEALQTPELVVMAEQLDYVISTPSVPTWNEVAVMLGKQMEKLARQSDSAEAVMAEAQALAEAIGVGE